MKLPSKKQFHSHWARLRGVEWASSQMVAKATPPCPDLELGIIASGYQHHGI